MERAKPAGRAGAHSTRRISRSPTLCLCDGRKPKVLIADEPTTALDVTVQAQILDLINSLKDKYDTSIIYITHDLGVIAETSDIVCVMYLGRIVEIATTEEIFSNPQHPYTQALIKSIPRIDKVN